MSVGLRLVRDEDIEFFYEHQREPEGAAMAMFPSRDRDVFFSHWAKTRARTDARAMTITYGNCVAGNIGSWEDDEHIFVGYWIGKEYWGRGIATSALNAYVIKHELRRPLRAHVAATNVGSIRVLEKCGFELVSRTTEFNPAFGLDVEELLMEYLPDVGRAS
jgi:RimJ/RimL family protein N-acetyltransferase